MPGTYPAPVRGESDELSWRSPVPAQENWRELIGTGPHEVANWFLGQPQSLLVATGTVLNAIEVDDEVGRRAARLLRATGHPAPIVALPNGRWLFLTTVSDELPKQLASNASVEWHAADDWIPLPPTPFQHGVVHWRVKPEVWGWQLPEADAVYDVLVRALVGEQSNTALRLVQTSAA
jgi:hypothetical protein